MVACGHGRSPTTTLRQFPQGSVTARDAGNEKSLKLRIPSSWVDGTKEDSGKVFAFVGAASIDMAERSDYRDPPAPPQEGFVRRLFFDMCDKDLKAGRAESSILVNGQPLSEVKCSASWLTLAGTDF